MAPRPNRRPGPLHVENGEVPYTTSSGYKIRGTVSPQGQLAMGLAASKNAENAGARSLNLNTNGQIDSAGTVRVRRSAPLTATISFGKTIIKCRCEIGKVCEGRRSMPRRYGRNRRGLPAVLILEQVLYATRIACVPIHAAAPIDPRSCFLKSAGDRCEVPA
jgi:hypothetical protein